MIVLAGCAAAAFAGLLWTIADRVARGRGIVWGGPPVVAIVMAGIAGGLSAASLPAPTAATLTATLVVTIVGGIVDARTGLIFDALTITGAAVVGLIAVAAGTGPQALAGASVAGGALLALHLITGRRGVGLGDVKLAAVVGLGLGVEFGLVALGCAFVAGAGYAIVLLATGRAHATDAVRFGPFIAAGTALGCAGNALGYRW